VKKTVDLAPVFSFLRQLEKHNDRGWFEEHRSDYETALGNFEQFVGDLIVEISEFDDLGSVSPRDCLFRIYRDVRFSKDKTPYKPYFGASIGEGGRKSMGFPYYVHVRPGDRSLLAGGWHEASTAQLSKWRAAVDKDAKTLKKIIGKKEFVTAFGGLSGDKLAKAPRGYPADHPDLDLLRLKEVAVMHTVTDKELLAPSAARQGAAIFKTMKPFLDYLGSLQPRMSG
jgi:uncharacterized protein (TIGR02453 family)